jgi:hypothetical protein
MATATQPRAALSQQRTVVNFAVCEFWAVFSRCTCFNIAPLCCDPEACNAVTSGAVAQQYEGKNSNPHRHAETNQQRLSSQVQVEVIHSPARACAYKGSKLSCCAYTRIETRIAIRVTRPTVACKETSVKMKQKMTSGILTPCSLVEVYRRLRNACCRLHHQESSPWWLRQ